MTKEEEAFWAGYYAPHDIPRDEVWRMYRKEHPEIQQERQPDYEVGIEDWRARHAG